MKLHFKPFLKLCSVVLILSLGDFWVCGASHVPCYFIFGDSLSDNGNNNNLLTLAKANYRPYGIDFLKDPTGRFTNARNLVDFIAEFLGFDDYIPPFTTTKGRDILKGVNYASGAAGIRDESGKTQGARISFNNQLRNHQFTISQINGLLNNSDATSELLKSCIYTVEIGSNDYLNNYFMPLFYTTSIQYTPQEYAMVLIKQFSQQLKVLYGLGARKVAIFGVGLIGCTPYARATFDPEGSPCVQNMNDAVQLFNLGIKSLVDDLNGNLTDAKFTFIDSFQISTTGVSTQSEIVSDTPCCEVASGQLQCVPFGNICANRTQYVFWDAVHPTEIGVISTASRAYNAKFPNDTYPFDINHLAQL